MQAGWFRFDSRLLLGDMKKVAPRAHLQKKDGSATSDRDTTRMRDSLPVAHVPCVRALRGSTGRVGVAAAFQRRHGRIVTAAQVIASNGPPCALLHPRRSPSLVGRAHGGHPGTAPTETETPPPPGFSVHLTVGSAGRRRVQSTSSKVDGWRSACAGAADASMK